MLLRCVNTLESRDKLDIILLAGSNAGRKSRAVIDMARELFDEFNEEINIKLYDLKEMDMPLADGKNYLDYGGEFTELLKSIVNADALLISAPVYNGGLPSALVNVLGALPNKALLKKAVGIIMTAGSNNHYLVAEHQLKPMLTYLKAQIVPSYVFVNERAFQGSEIIDSDVAFRIQDLITDLVLLTKGVKFMAEEEEKFLGF